MSTEGTFIVSQTERNKGAGLIAVRSIRTLATHIIDIADSARAMRTILQMLISITSEALQETGICLYCWPIRCTNRYRYGISNRLRRYKSPPVRQLLGTAVHSDSSMQNGIPNRAGNQTLARIANGGIRDLPPPRPTSMRGFACRPTSRMVRGFGTTMGCQFGRKNGRVFEASEERPSSGSIVRLFESSTGYRNLESELGNEKRPFERSGTKQFECSIVR